MLSLCGAETTALSESSAVIHREYCPTGKAAFLVEMVEDGSVDSGKFL